MCCIVFTTPYAEAKGDEIHGLIFDSSLPRYKHDVNWPFTEPVVFKSKAYLTVDATETFQCCCRLC